MPRLHEHVDPAALRRLLRSHLPFSLPAYSALLTPGNPVKVYATFLSTHGTGLEGEEPVGDKVWVVLIDTGNQFRFYCNAQRNGRQEGRENTREAENLISEVIREVMEQAVRDRREVVRLGAIPDEWTKVVESVTGVKCISASRIWCDPSYYEESIRLSNIYELERPEIREELMIQEEFELRDAKEEDIPIILSTSEVPHLPSYLLTRLAHTSCLFSTTPLSSSTTSSTAGELAAHVTTHRDGSLGTLYVNPSYRRLGLARLVLRHRLSRMRQDEAARGEKVGYCYVHRENEPSRAVMKSLGWRESEGNVSWDIVDAKEWERRERLRN